MAIKKIELIYILIGEIIVNELIKPLINAQFYIFVSQI